MNPDNTPSERDFVDHSVSRIIVQVGDTQPTLHSLLPDQGIVSAPYQFDVRSGEFEAMQSAETMARATGSVAAWYSVSDKPLACYWVRPPRFVCHTDESYQDAETGRFWVVKIEENLPGYTRVASYADLDSAQANASGRNLELDFPGSVIVNILASSMAAHNVAKYGDPEASR